MSELIGHGGQFTATPRIVGEVVRHFSNRGSVPRQQCHIAMILLLRDISNVFNRKYIVVVALQIRNNAVDLVNGFAKRLNRLVNLSRVLVQLLLIVLQHGQLLVSLIGHGGFLAPQLQDPIQLIQHTSLVGLMAMKDQTEILQPRGGQAAVYNVQSRHFFRHKQHLFPRGQTLRDDIGNGLALARTGRSLQYKAHAPLSHQNSVLLAGVGIHDLENLQRLFFSIEIKVLQLIGNSADRGSIAADGPDNGVLHDGILVRVQIRVHIDLQKRKQTQANLTRNRPASQGGPALDQIQKQTNVIRIIKLGQSDPKVVLQLVNQGGVYGDLILMQIQYVRGVDGLHRQGHGHQNQGRNKRLIGVIRFGPRQKAKG